MFGLISRRLLSLKPPVASQVRKARLPGRCSHLFPLWTQMSFFFFSFLFLFFWRPATADKRRVILFFHY